MVEADAPLIDVLIIGDKAVGKTCIVHAFCGRDFDEQRIATTGVDFVKHEYMSDAGKLYKVKFWDSAGQEHF